MADSSLTVTPGTGGDQNPTTNSDLQATGANDVNSNQSRDFQPGITGDSLNSTQGIALSPTALSTVDLSGSTSGTAVAKAAPVQTQHINPVLLAGVVLLFVVAAVMFVATSQSGKKYNQY